MNTRFIEVGVGVFMAAGLAALAFLALEVSGLTFTSQEPTYRVSAKFENIGGLTDHAKVTMAGVYIGRVVNITLDPKDYSAKVDMDINKTVDYLSKDTTASILTSGLLGEKYIGLSTGADKQYLQEGDMIHDTQSALVLEELIGSFLASKAKE